MIVGNPNVLNRPTDKSRELKARIISGSVVLLSGSSLATAINLAYNMAVARFLGPKGFGHATAVYTLLTMASAVTLSFQITSAKVVAQQSSEEGRDAVYRDLHRAAWACGLLLGALICLFRQGITTYLNLPSTWLVVFLGIGAAFYVPLGSRRGYIQGVYGFRSLAKNLVLEGAVRLGGSLLMIVLGFGVIGVIAANAAAMAVAYLAIAPKLVARIPNPLQLGTAFREIIQALVFFSGQVLINNCDIVLVKHFFVAEQAGLYAAVALVGRVTFSFSSAVVNSMFPVVAGTGAEERRNLSLIATSLLLVLSVGCVFALGLRFAPAWIWTRIFGPSFQIAGPHGFPYLLALYAITTVIYSLSVVIITYEMSYKIANTSWLQLLFSGVLIASICRYHGSLLQVIMVQLVLMVVLLVVVAIPFLVNAMRDSQALNRTGFRPMRLIRRISEDDVIAEFLKSDFENEAYSDYHQTLREMVYEPDLGDQSEDAKRRALLFLRHRSLWKELPEDTEWYEAEVTTEDLKQIQVFPRAHWRKIARGNFSIVKVVERIRSWEREKQTTFVEKITNIRQGLLQRESNRGSVLLIGLNEMEPMTILDGNHRLVAAVLEGKVDRLRFVCGLSPGMTRCCWYRTNLVNLVGYGSNLLRHVVHRPGADLERLCETSNRNKAWQQ
jgi:O-antigen/teichoic acid export membrane protein